MSKRKKENRRKTGVVSPSAPFPTSEVVSNATMTSGYAAVARAAKGVNRKRLASVLSPGAFPAPAIPRHIRNRRK